MIRCTYLPAFLLILFSCTKDMGRNPQLALSDKAMHDSCSQQLRFYRNDSTTLFNGSRGAHGPYRLRMNSIAFRALTDNGQLPKGSLMPEGSLLVKDVYDGSRVSLYAFMYKRSGSWIWGEVEPNRTVHYSVKSSGGLCVNCHSVPPQRDLVRTFDAY